MSPLLDTPLTRRKAVASVLALMAVAPGTRASESARCDEGDTSQPRPESSVNWGAQVRLYSDHDDLPLRHVDVEATLRFDGSQLRMHLYQFADPAIIDGVEQPDVPLGDFVFLGDPAPLLDRLSTDADRAWLKQRQHWAERPSEVCPACLGLNHRRPSCTRCAGHGWVRLTRADGQRIVEQEHGERVAMIVAAIAAGRR